MELFKKSLVVIVGVTLVAGYANVFAVNQKRIAAVEKAKATRLANAAKRAAAVSTPAPVVSVATTFEELQRWDDLCIAQQEDAARNQRFDKHMLEQTVANLVNQASELQSPASQFFANHESDIVVEFVADHVRDIAAAGLLTQVTLGSVAPVVTVVTNGLVGVGVTALVATSGRRARAKDALKQAYVTTKEKAHKVVAAFRAKFSRNGGASNVVEISTQPSAQQ